jgi:hypothetical protein
LSFPKGICVLLSSAKLHLDENCFRRLLINSGFVKVAASACRKRLASKAALAAEEKRESGQISGRLSFSGDETVILF